MRWTCVTCGCSGSRSKPHRAGKSQEACPTCGASKSHWLKIVDVDPTLPSNSHDRSAADEDRRATARQRREDDEYRIARELEERREAERCTLKLGDKQRADDAWLESHERRMAALRRLGLDVRADDSLSRCEFIYERALRDMQEVENKTNPQGELLTAARSGDAYAIARADALFGSSWRKLERKVV